MKFGVVDHAGGRVGRVRVTGCLLAGFVAFAGAQVALGASTNSGQLFMPHGNAAARATGDYVSRNLTAPAGLNSPYRYFIEVPQGLNRLVVDIFDADIGLGGTAEAAAGRDRLNPGGGTTWDTATNYQLYNPAGVLQPTSFTVGDATGPAGSDNAWLTFYDSSVPVAPSLVNSTNNTVDGTSLGLNVPALTATNDLLIVAIARDLDGTTGTVSPPGPAGSWTLLNEGDCPAASCALAIFYRVVGASVPGSPQTFTWTGGQKAAGAMFTFRGIDTTSPFDTSVAANTGSTTDPVALGVTTVTANALVLRLVGAGPSVAFTPPASHAEIWDAGVGGAGGGTQVRGSAATVVRATAGSTGSGTFTAATNRWRTATVALRPAAPPAPASGHWELRVDLSTAATTGDDINAFGIRAHDGNAGAGGTEVNAYYDSHAAFGVNLEGPSTPRTYTLYPWVTSGCTCRANDFDYDSNSGNVGSITLDGRGGTPRASFASSLLSANDAWASNTVPAWTDNLNSTDYGIWTAGIVIGTYPNNSNYSNVYFTNDQAAAPPPAANPTANAFRVYLPTDAGAAPPKPYLEQQVRYRSGSQTVTNGVETIVTVTVRLVNPTPHAITFGSPSGNVVTAFIPGGQATCYQTSCGAQTNLGTFTTPAAGGSGAITWNPGTVPAGATAILGYDVRLFPTSGGVNPIPITGTPASNGTRATYVDETGNTVQARATATLGPLCGLDTARVLLTEAVLSGFSAFRNRDGVLLRWETASEVGTAGFRVFRRDPGSGRFLELTDEPVAAVPEAPQGAAYELLDAKADPGSRHVYRLAEVELDGNERDLGTFEIVPRDVPGTWNSRPAPRGPWPQKPEPALRDPGVSGGSPASVAGAKIAVSSSGLHFVTAASLAKALALPEEAVQKRILSGSVAMSNKGAPVAWLPAAEGEGIYFYGREIDDPYSATNVYRLTTEPGPRMQSVSVALPMGRGLLSSRATRHAEVDLYPVINGPLDPEDDFWFWDYLVAGDATHGRKPFTLQVPAVASGAGRATLTVGLHGMSASGKDREHHVRVYLNGSQVAEELWQGITPLSIVASVSQSLLLDGENTVEVEAVRGPGIPYSYVYVDGFDVTYERRHEAERSALIVGVPEGQAVTVRGFADPAVRVLDVTSPAAPRLLEQASVELGKGGYQATFTAPKGSRDFLLTSDAGLLTPKRVWRDTSSSLRTRDNAADYLILTPPELVAAAEGLADLRRRSGLRAQVVDVEDVYDEFSFGLPSPRAIQSFLAYARASWASAPSFVVLAGAGTYDYKDLLGMGGNLVPPLLVSTPRGMFSSDALLADVGGPAGVAGDGVPDLAIGRLPVTSPQELLAQVEKIRAFEDARSGDWAGRALLVADDPDRGVDFGAESDVLWPRLLGGLTAERVFLGPLPLAGAREALLGHWRSGAALVNYLGHGGHDRWANEGLLVNSDVASLDNAERLPLVTSMTCVIGRFEIPGLDSLGEALVRRVGGGALAVWAPSAAGNHSDSRMLAGYFASALSVGAESSSKATAAVDKTKGTIGGAVVSALGQLSAGGGDMNTGTFYNLLGDPAVRLRSVPPPPPSPPPTDDGTRE